MRDELALVGEVVSESELVQTALNGVAMPRVVFCGGYSSQGELAFLGQTLG